MFCEYSDKGLSELGDDARRDWWVRKAAKALGRTAARRNRLCDSSTRRRLLSEEAAAVVSPAQAETRLASLEAANNQAASSALEKYDITRGRFNIQRKRAPSGQDEPT